MFRLLLTVLALGLSAAAFAERDKDSNEQSFGLGAIKGSATQQLQVAPDAGISDSKAASLVKKQYGSSRILGVSKLDEGGGSPVYRVRTLSEDGVVKSVFVDGSSGEVFE